ncbi:antitoxin MazE family protein [Bartonella raoultii]|uniref:Antitoxin MazE family protein n=1 Tax=Bartonella raoultii TaxID=1457020 RepID=A0ABS7I4H6_9HYPH|nr:antitoxin MazE family protein [Bartonella raoultii]MBX4335701.1 antitoxin MazE family protein [Bartonella raoultii]
MGTMHVNERVQKHRNAQRKAGLRLMQIWVPDTRQPSFAEECRRQTRLVAKVDKANASIQLFMDQSLMDIDGWIE